MLISTNEFVRDTKKSYVPQRTGSVGLMSRGELAHCRHWGCAFAGKRKYHRYYELVEDTIRQGFDYRSSGETSICTRLGKLLARTLVRASRSFAWFRPMPNTPQQLNRSR